MAETVYGYFAPPLPGGVIDDRGPFAVLLYRGVDPQNLGAYEGLDYLLRVTLFDPSATLDLPMPFPGGELDYRTPGYCTIQGNASTVWPAATLERSSVPEDVPANTYVPARFTGAFNYQISLFDGADPTTRGKGTVGVLQLVDPEGELDALVRLGWDNAPLSILRGDQDALFSAWTVVANMTTAGLLYDTQQKEIRLRDLSWLLEQAELHGARYLGTGGIEGDSSLAGRIKPYAVGKVFNLSPVTVNGTALIYQASFTSLMAVDSVRDGGAELDFDADYPTYEALEAASVPDAHYATCLALGLCRVGSQPVYGITMDVRGDNDTLDGHTYPSTRAQIARRVAAGRGALRLDDATQIDGQAYSRLEQYQSATLGYYWDSEITKAAALSEVMAGCSGWWLVRVNGLLAFGQLEDPATSAPLFAISFPGEDAGEVRVGDPVMVAYNPPRRGTLMGWSRNYTMQAPNALASVSVGAELQAVYGAASRYTASGDPWVANNYPSSPVVTIEGGFAFEADAQIEGDRVQRILRTPRERWQIPVIMDPMADVPGRVIRVDGFNRFGVGASKNFFSPGLTVNGGAKVLVDLWG